MNEPIMPAVSSPNGDKGLSVESFAGQPTLRSDCTSPVKPLVTLPLSPPRLSRLSCAPKSRLCLWAGHRWAPWGYRFPDSLVKSHSGGGKGLGCPRPSTERRWSGPCRDRTYPSGTARFVAAEEKERSCYTSEHGDSNLKFKKKHRNVRLLSVFSVAEVWKTSVWIWRLQIFGAWHFDCVLKCPYFNFSGVEIAGFTS